MLSSEVILPIVVRDLRAKLRLLMAFGSHRDWPALAAQFGRKRDTLEWWANGSSVRAPGAVPARHLSRLVDLFAEILPQRSRADVEQLVLSSAGEIDEALRAQSTPSLVGLIKAEGQRDTVRLHRMPGQSGLVAFHAPDGADGSCPRLGLGEPFYIELRIERAGHAIVLQNAQQAWAAIPFVNGARMRMVPVGPLLLPGMRSDGSPQYLKEERDIGRHLFACLLTPKAFPAEMLHAAANHTVLDGRLLDRIAAFYGEQPKSERAIHVLELNVERPGR